MVLHGLFHPLARQHVTTPRPVAAGCPCQPSRTQRILWPHLFLPTLPWPQPLSFNYPAHSLPEIQEKTRTLNILVRRHSWRTTGFFLVYWLLSEWSHARSRNGQDHVVSMYAAVVSWAVYIQNTPTLNFSSERQDHQCWNYRSPVPWIKINVWQFCQCEHVHCGILCWCL